MKNVPIKSSITHIKPGEIKVRGALIQDLMGIHTFSEVIFLLLVGKLPNVHQARMLDAVLVSSVDHGVNAPSAFVARTVASCGSPVQTCMAAGLSAVGEHHGGAGEACAQMLQEATQQNPDGNIEMIAENIVQEFVVNKKRLPGFGHRVHDPDPRTVRLFELAEQEGFYGRYLNLMIAIQSQWVQQTGKTLPINVDGAIAAIISELGLDWQLGKSIFIIARSAGLAAHVHEQMSDGKPMQFAPPVEILDENLKAE
ncbi:MAG: citryl-CoA lyase [Anaerolineaceae bacterium]|nr:citryl-CoA lyase [Anaerolineaceae bacterium]